jgi:hypothetical protein
MYRILGRSDWPLCGVANPELIRTRLAHLDRFRQQPFRATRLTQHDCVRYLRVAHLASQVSVGSRQPVLPRRTEYVNVERILECKGTMRHL